MVGIVRRVFSFLGLIVAMFFLVSAARSSDVPSLSLPLDCDLGEDCWIQNLVDFNSGPNWSDPFCGTASYDGHKGTDFRIRSIPDLKKKVPVYAMAAGKVLGSRNSMTDRLVENAADENIIKGRECGNGTIVDIGNGWTTQYCHLAKDSVTVKKGYTVKRGDILGMIGLSGFTTFPHVHVTIRKNEMPIDPMTGRAQNAGCSPQKGLNNKTLWDALAQEKITGEYSAVIAKGFTSDRVERSDVLKGEVQQAKQEGPLIFYAHFINLQKNDRVELTIHGPDGTFATHMGKPLPSPKATWTTFTGQHGYVLSGTYTGTTKLYRDGKVVISSEALEIMF